MSGIRVTEFALEIFTVDTVLSATRSCTMYINGTNATNYMPLYTEGNAPATGYIPLYMAGHLPNDSGMPLYVCGHIPGSGSMPLYTLSTSPSSGYIPLYMAGHLPNVSGLPLYCAGHIQQNSGIPLVCWNLPTSGTTTLYIGDLGGRTDNSMPLYLYNSASISGATLVIWGKSYSSGPNPGVGWYSTYGQAFLYIEGQGKSNILPLYLQAVTGYINTNAPLYINSLIPSTGSMPLYMPSVDTKTSNPKLYTHGF